MTNYPGGIPVKRYAFIANNRKEIEVNYRRLNVILLTNKHMRDIDGFLKTSFERTGQLQVSNRVKY